MSDPARDSATTRGGGEAYLLFTASLLLVVTLGSVVQLLSLTVGLALTELVLIALPAILYVRWKRLPVAAALRWRSVAPGTALLSVAMGVTAWGVAAGMYELSVPVLGEPPETPGMQPETLPELLVLLLCAALLAGLCEETLFRGAIQGVLRRGGAVKAVVITAFLFAVYHVNPWLLGPAFFLGLVFGCLVVRTGSTVPAILAHFANNATAFTVAFLLHDRPDSVAHMVMAGLALAFCGTSVLFWKRARAVDDGPPLLATVPARLSRPVAWIAGLLGGGAVLLLFATITVVFMVVAVHTVTSDGLEPEIRQGDQLIMHRAGFTTPDVEAGDIISIRRDGATVLGRVARVDDETVWIVQGTVEEVLPRAQIEGKMVYRIPATE